MGFEWLASLSIGKSETGGIPQGSSFLHHSGNIWTIGPNWKSSLVAISELRLGTTPQPWLQFNDKLASRGASTKRLPANKRSLLLIPSQHSK